MRSKVVKSSYQKVFCIPCFGIKKASFKGIYTLNGVHLSLFQYRKFEREGHSLFKVLLELINFKINVCRHKFRQT